jgi:hypothetical protein
MSGSSNKAIIIGRLGTIHELKHTAQEMPVNILIYVSCQDTKISLIPNVIAGSKI